MGIATELEIRKFLQPDTARDSDFQELDRKIVSHHIKTMAADGCIQKVQIESIENKTYYILPGTLDIKNKSMPRLHILTPFDNLIIQRERIKKLFNFDYTLECYVPASKRKYGYFSCPLLYDNRLVGQVDPKVDRKEKYFIIQSLHLEPDFEPAEAFFLQLRKELNRMKVFNQCDTIQLKKVLPVKYRALIKQYAASVNE